MNVEESAVGTLSRAHRPLNNRYSPNDAGVTPRSDVPNATHELLVVHPIVESGTEILIAGKPVTWGAVTVAVAHDANIAPATDIVAATRASERARAATRIIVSL
jgi:hypothetical protein